MNENEKKRRSIDILIIFITVDHPELHYHRNKLVQNQNISEYDLHVRPQKALSVIMKLRMVELSRILVRYGGREMLYGLFYQPSRGVGKSSLTKKRPVITAWNPPPSPPPPHMLK